MVDKVMRKQTKVENVDKGLSDAVKRIDTELVNVCEWINNASVVLDEVSDRKEFPMVRNVNVKVKQVDDGKSKDKEIIKGVKNPDDISWKKLRNKREYQAFHEVLLAYQKGGDVEGLCRKRLAVMLSVNESGWSSTLEAFGLVEDKDEEVEAISGYEDQAKLAKKLAIEQARNNPQGGKNNEKNSSSGWNNIPPSVFQRPGGYQAPRFQASNDYQPMNVLASSQSGLRQWGSRFNGGKGYVQGGQYQGVCYNCGMWGHSAANCSVPKKGFTCFTCGKNGHTSVRCPEKQNTGWRGGQWGQGVSQFFGSCFVCGVQGHRASECTKKAGGQAAWNQFVPSLPQQGQYQQQSQQQQQQQQQPQQQQHQGPV
jgi:hypothetical protein